MRLVEVGGAVEEPGGMWHVVRDAERTYCEFTHTGWARVANATERGGMWCGVCLMLIARTVDRSKR